MTDALVLIGLSAIKCIAKWQMNHPVQSNWLMAVTGCAGMAHRIKKKIPFLRLLLICLCFKYQVALPNILMFRHLDFQNFYIYSSNNILILLLSVLDQKYHLFFRSRY